MKGALVVCVLAACSYKGSPGTGDDVTGDDAPPGDGSGIDAMLAPCNFDEAADATNNTSAGAEPTGLTFSAPTVLCGKLDSGHFDGVADVVDIDAYKITISATTDVIMHLTGPGSEALDRVIIQILGPTGAPQLGFGSFNGTHGTLIAHLPPSDYVIGVAAANGSAIAAAIPYRVELRTDTPDQRCVKGSAVAHTVAEQNDGNNDDGNDMVTIDEASGTPRKLTVSAADNPEPAGNSDPTLRVTGTSADANAPDDYEDRDTFEFTTGPNTNQLSVRLNWPSITSDFDFILFDQNTVTSLGSGLGLDLAEDEFDTFAVEPNHSYWLWIGTANGSTVPATYEATICNETFTP